MKVLSLLAFALSMTVVLLLVRSKISPRTNKPALTIAPIPIPNVVVSPPNVSATDVVMGIFPTRPRVTPQAAASLAAFMHREYRSAGNWKSVQIFVFRDLTTANLFNAYQGPRRQFPLRAVDYVALKNLWPKTLVVYEYRNGREQLFYPPHNPTGWWRYR